MGVTVTEDVSVKLGVRPISVFDSVGVTEVGEYASFGITSKLASGGGITRDEIRGCKFASITTGTLQSIYIYLLYGGTSPKVKCALYDSSLDLVTNGTTEEKVLGGSQDGWLSFDFSTPPSVVKGSTYYLCYWSDDSPVQYYDGEGSTDQYFKQFGEAYGSWPASLVPTSEEDRRISIYATYVPTPKMLLNSFVNVSDSISLSESISSLLPFLVVGVSDSASISESIARTLVNFIDVSDTTTVTESIIRELISFISVNDSVTLAESIVVQFPFLTLDIFDSVSVAESITGLIPLLFIEGVYDSVSISERYRAIFGWILAPPTTTIWTDVSPSATTWSDVTPSTATWTDVNKPDRWYT